MRIYIKLQFPRILPSWFYSFNYESAQPAVKLYATLKQKCSILSRNYNPVIQHHNLHGIMLYLLLQEGIFVERSEVESNVNQKAGNGS